MNWFKKMWHGPPLADKYAKQLREAETDLAVHQHNLEYNAAMVPMLEGRVNRLRTAIAKTASPQHETEVVERAEVGDMATETRTITRLRRTE